jgi:hypothetical protein
MLGKQKKRLRIRRFEALERETGFEPATSTLARLHSTTELFPLNLSRSQLSKDHVFVKTKSAQIKAHSVIGQLVKSSTSQMVDWFIGKSGNSLIRHCGHT